MRPQHDHGTATHQSIMEADMSKEIASQWLKEITDTANAKDHLAHMALISKRVSLHGMPEYEGVKYDDWFRQCKHEFENGILKRLQYDGLKMVSSNDKAIMFKTFETVEGSDGTVNALGVEILLEKEEDGKWRMVRERILSPVETARDKLLPQAEPSTS